jgi:hypothetical protein
LATGFSLLIFSEAHAVIDFVLAIFLPGINEENKKENKIQVNMIDTGAFIFARVNASY